MYHTVWPEGQPEKAFQTDSSWRAFIHLHKNKLYSQLPWNLSKARRMRWSCAAEGYPNPYVVEQSMEESGMIIPPGGWPLQTDLSDCDLIYGEVRTVTYSAI